MMILNGVFRIIYDYFNKRVDALYMAWSVVYIVSGIIMLYWVFTKCQ